MEGRQYSDGWTFGELATAAGVAPRTVEEWNTEGLLPQPVRTPPPGQGRGRAPYRFPPPALEAACALGRWREAFQVNTNQAKAFLWLEGFDYLQAPGELDKARDLADEIVRFLAIVKTKPGDAVGYLRQKIDRYNSEDKRWEDGRDPIPAEVRWAYDTLVKRLVAGPSWERQFTEGLERAIAVADSETVDLGDGNSVTALGPKELFDDAYIESGFDLNLGREFAALLTDVLGKGIDRRAIDFWTVPVLDRMLSGPYVNDNDPRAAWQTLCRLTDRQIKEPLAEPLDDILDVFAGLRQEAYRRGPKMAMTVTLVFARYGGGGWLQQLENIEAEAKREWEMQHQSRNRPEAE